MKKFNNKKVAKKQEPVEEVEDSGEDEEVELDGSEDEDDGEEEEDEDDDNLLDDEAVEDDGEEEDDDEDDDEGLEDDDEDDEEDDDDDDEDEDDNPLAPKKVPFDTPKVEAKHDLVAKFLDINGKRLYVRFPKRLPESKEELDKQLKSFCPLIKEVIKPRQKHANHCMIEFASKEDREKGLKKLSTVKVDDKLLIVKLPTMEDKSKVETAIDKKEKKKHEKKMKQKLRKLAKKKAALSTSTLFITNIPPTATVADIKEHFPNAVDIKLKHSKDSQDTAKCSVTLPTPEDATKARKLKITIQDNLLHVKFDVSVNKGWRAKQNKKYKQGNLNNKKPAEKRKNDQSAPQPAAKKVKKEKATEGETEKKAPVKAKAKPSFEKKKGKKPKPNKKPVAVKA